MRARGISYDTGFVLHGSIGHPGFDPERVRREMAVIRDELHCNAVRVMGGDPARLEVAARIAAGLGLEVWFSPYPLELDEDEILTLFADCAARAERIRRTGAEVVFVAGAELSLMNPGFLPGATIDERISALRADLAGQITQITAKIRAFLAEAVKTIRTSFQGPITYASVPFERVDWDLFDIVSIDLYRSAEVAGRFAGDVRELVRTQPKPIAITEFGAAGFRGAGDRGANGLEIVEYDRATREPLRLTGVFERDEPGQATYLRELIEIFDEAGVDATFVFTFALRDHPHRPAGDPRDDLDLASYGIVKVLEEPGREWEPKAAFHALADAYGEALRSPVA